jgi:iron complex outermembrane receptor protein
MPPVAGNPLRFAGSPEFTSEKLIAYELGYRVQPLEALSLSVASFYNQYDDLRSTELPYLASGDLTVEFRNGLEGDSRGVEFSGAFQAASWWKLRGGYTYLEKDLWVKSGHTDYTKSPTKPRGEWSDPAHQFSLQSMTDLPGGFQANLFGYFVDELPLPMVQRRFAYDASLVWTYRNLEVSVNGRNLADDQDPEFRVPDDSMRGRGRDIQRSVYGKITWRL